MNFNQINKTILNLSLIDGIGPGFLNELIKRVGFENLPNLKHFTPDQFLRLGINESKIESLLIFLKNDSFVDRELELISSKGFDWITIFDSDYPEALKNIHVPPVVLYFKGNIKNLDNSLAIVGSRKATLYAKRVVEKMVPDFVSNGLVTVSGGALGVDTFVHEETIKSGGRTVAVMGSGLMSLYPSQNKKLFDKIVDSDGALISTFSMLTTALPGNFPARNRIISGLSLGTLVIQAAKKSGALITANYAMEQSREVFAIPGNIDDLMSEGCNSLIKEGAKLVSSSKDIFEELGIYSDFNLNFGPRSLECAAKDPIVEFCFEPKTIDEISEKTGLGLNDLHIKLFDLQVEGKIEQDFTGYWRAL